MYVYGACLFFVCCSDCVWICGNDCCVAAFVKVSGFMFIVYKALLISSGTVIVSAGGSLCIDKPFCYGII